jgi:hypothetical protein
VYVPDPEMLDSDFEALPDWSDFWITANHS